MYGTVIAVRAAGMYGGAAVESRHAMRDVSAFFGPDGAGRMVLTNAYFPTALGQIIMSDDRTQAWVKISLGMEKVSIPLHADAALNVGAFSLRFESNATLKQITVSSPRVGSAVQQHSPYLLKQRVRSPAAQKSGSGKVVYVQKTSSQQGSSLASASSTIPLPNTMTADGATTTPASPAGETTAAAPLSQKQLAAFNSALAHSNEAILIKNDELAAAKQSLARKEAAVASRVTLLSKDRQREQVFWRARVKKFKDISESAAAAAAAAQEKEDEAAAEVAKYQRMAAEAENRLKAKAAEVSEISKRATVAERRAAAAEARIVAVTAAAEADKVAEIKSFHDEHSKQLKDKHNKVVELQDAVEALRAELAAAATDLANTKAELTEVNKFAEEAISLAEDKTAEVDRMTSSLAARDTEIESLRDEVAAERAAKSEIESSLSAELAILQSQLESVASEEEQKALLDKISVLEHEKAAITEKYKNERVRRRELHNLIVELQGNIRVFARVRPMLKPEDEASSEAAATFNPQSSDIQGDPWEEVAEAVDDEVMAISTKRNHRRSFEFDRVFDKAADQAEIFKSVAPLVTSLLDGYKVCIVAYGQTGSGKTFTMEGSEEAPGVIPRALHEIFQLIERNKVVDKYALELSIYEIYNNEVADLLVTPEEAAECRYDIQTAGDGSIHISGLSMEPVSNIEEVRGLIATAHGHRAMGATAINAHSSRSHCIVCLHISTTDAETGAKKPLSKLTLVDLAGSECVGMSGVTGDALRETKHINRSLSSLADVMTAMRKNNPHIPFRNSKLTQCLSDSLGGDAKFLLIVTVSPVRRFMIESTHALAFGASVRQVITSGPAGGATSSRYVPSRNTVSNSSAGGAGAGASGSDAPSSPRRGNKENSSGNARGSPRTPRSKAAGGNSSNKGRTPTGRTPTNRTPTNNNNNNTSTSRTPTRSRGTRTPSSATRRRLDVDGVLGNVTSSQVVKNSIVA